MPTDSLPAAGQPDKRKPKLPAGTQFSLRTLLIFVTFWVFPCSWLRGCIRMREAREQKAAVEEIVVLGGSVVYDYQIHPSGNWRQRL